MKEKTYEKESLFLSPFAKKSCETAGRARQEEPCALRTDFQRDRDRIIYSKAFMRLKNKTQVFFSPDGDHYITRLTHTLDVCQIARSIARCLCLNEDLAEAIALGHDLGHTPCGHIGERVLNELSPYGFRHNEQSLRVVDILENECKGLNLTYEVRDGILHHTSKGTPSTLEGYCVSLADRIAYINHDIADAVRGGVIKESDLPKEEISILGRSTGARIDTAIKDVVAFSAGKNFVRMSERIQTASDNLRRFMFEEVYAKVNEKTQKSAERMLSAMFAYFLHHKDKIPQNYKILLEDFPLEVVVCDYLSSMTDRYAINVFEDLFVPKNFSFDGATV